MVELSRKDEKVVREVWNRDAVALFESMGEKYKAEIIASIPADREIGLYREGKFVDLCRGPHVPSTGKLKVFADEGGRCLLARRRQQRDAPAHLRHGPGEGRPEAYLHMLEEAEKRDHRKLGKTLDLFHLQEEAPAWSSGTRRAGRSGRRSSSICAGAREAGYQEVRTPVSWIVPCGRSRATGRTTRRTCSSRSRRSVTTRSPMNCPGHVQIFNHGLRSYRDLPLRLAEPGACHRNEPSGALHGLMRVRGFVQDDAHIFCTEEQIVAEAKAFNELAFSVYDDFGFKDVAVKLSLRPEQRAGSDEIWDHAEEGLRPALRLRCGVEELPGEGAFYGPKVEYHIKDAIGRSAVRHAAARPRCCRSARMPSSSLRTIRASARSCCTGPSWAPSSASPGILLENHAGALPARLAPEQVVVMNIADSRPSMRRALRNCCKTRV